MVRFILIILLFLASLLCIFKAPTYHAWIVSILVTEFPLVFLLGISLLLIWGVIPQSLRIAGNCIAIVTFFLFLSPIARSIIIAHTLPGSLQEALGSTEFLHKPVNEKPFTFSKMISGFLDKEVALHTMTYSVKDGVGLTLDYYPSQQKGRRPCIVVVHGGSWAAGDSRQLPELNSYLAEAGYQVVSINYRLAPKYQNPAPVADVRDALAYLRENADKLNIDTTQFVLLGRSAGAQIALLAAYTLHDPNIKGVIDFYGPADMVWGYSVPSNPLVMDSRKVMEDYLGGTYVAVPQNYLASSPVAAVTSESVPTLIIHGQNDVLVAYEHSIRLSKKLKENKVKHFLLTLPWATHGCDYTLHGPSGQLNTYTISWFLKEVVQ